MEDYTGGFLDQSHFSVPSAYCYKKSDEDKGHGEFPTDFDLDLPPRKFVTELVNQHKVVVFSKSQCPHCVNSKQLLSEMGVNYKTVELDEVPIGSQVQNELGKITDARTVPRIFIGGQCVGGNSDLRNLNESGELFNLLSDL